MNDETQPPALHAPEEGKWKMWNENQTLRHFKGNHDNLLTNFFSMLFMVLHLQSCLLCPTVSYN